MSLFAINQHPAWCNMSSHWGKQSLRLCIYVKSVKWQRPLRPLGLTQGRGGFIGNFILLCAITFKHIHILFIFFAAFLIIVVASCYK